MGKKPAEDTRKKDSAPTTKICDECGERFERGIDSLGRRKSAEKTCPVCRPATRRRRDKERKKRSYVPVNERSDTRCHKCDNEMRQMNLGSETWECKSRDCDEVRYIGKD